MNLLDISNEIEGIIGDTYFNIEIIDNPSPMYTRKGEIGEDKTLIIINLCSEEVVKSLKEFTDTCDEFYEIWRGGESLTFLVQKDKHC